MSIRVIVCGGRGTADIHAEALQARLRARRPVLTAQARAQRQTLHDPIDALLDLFHDLPGDQQFWRGVIDEPYDKRPVPTHIIVAKARAAGVEVMEA